jgi:hypothetical protein
MLGVLDTAGERVAVDCALPWAADLIAEGAAGELHDGADGADGAATVLVTVERDRSAFDVGHWLPLARGAWARDGEVVLENVCTTGFDLRLSWTAERADFTYRWRPPARDRAAARVLRSRFHLLARAALVQFPALWWAGTKGRAPLHASACTAERATPLLTAPSGIGRSTVTVRELEAGGVATGDNLAAGDGLTIWGLVEPLRVKGAGGRRMPHGRSEAVMTGRADALAPDSVVVLARGHGDRVGLEACEPATAPRSMVTSTYMAGELRRFWAFAATLAAGTGAGPSHPPVGEVASLFAERLPCFVLRLGSPRDARVSELLAALEEVKV